MQTLHLKFGRILYSLPMAVFGIEHFVMAQNMTGMVPSYIPGDLFWVYLTGAALIAASISIMTKKKVWWATMLLSVMLLTFILTVHLPTVFSGQVQMGLINLLKDLGLIGGALFIGGHAANEEERDYKEETQFVESKS